MSPSAYITVRTVKAGKRYVVRYRVGGRDTKLLHAGSFKTMKQARVRRDFVAGELAAGRDPRESLNALAEQKAPALLSDVYETWKASRIDVDERTLANYGFHWKRIGLAFGDVAPESITHVEAQEWINALTAELTPAVVRDYAGTLRQLLDFAGVEPNPLRHHAIRYPAAERKVPVPPTDKHVLAILEHMPWDVGGSAPRAKNQHVAAYFLPPRSWRAALVRHG